MVLPTDPRQPVPASIQLTLTWNGTAQAPITFSTTGHQLGDSYLLAVQVAAPVAAAGLYGWSISVSLDDGSGLEPAGTLTGQTPVVVRDPSPYGAGRGLDGLDQLFAVSGGVLWVTGAGDSRLFTQNPDGSFVSPAEDLGQLVQNEDGSYTYTAHDQTQEQFNSAGLLTAVTDTHGLSTDYFYDDASRLIQVNSMDGGVTTLDYGSTGFLDSLTEPGGRILNFTQTVNGDTSDLTAIEDADGARRALTYNDAHQLTRDQWQPYDTSFSYDAIHRLVYRHRSGAGRYHDRGGRGRPGAAKRPDRGRQRRGLRQPHRCPRRDHHLPTRCPRPRTLRAGRHQRHAVVAAQRRRPGCHLNWMPITTRHLPFGPWRSLETSMPFWRPCPRCRCRTRRKLGRRPCRKLRPTQNLPERLTLFPRIAR